MTNVGEYKEQICALCERPITYQDALYPNGVQTLYFGCRAHRKCYQERYRERVWTPPQEEQAQMELKA